LGDFGLHLRQFCGQFRRTYRQKLTKPAKGEQSAFDGITDNIVAIPAKNKENPAVMHHRISLKKRPKRVLV